MADSGSAGQGDVGEIAAVNGGQAILPTLRQKGWGRIVNITSLVTLGMVNRLPMRAA